MKTFFYSKHEKKAQFGTNVTLKVYQVKKGIPVYIGDATYNTQAYRGEDHEAAQVIISHKLLPLKVMDGSKTSYINYDEFNKRARLISLDYISR